MPRMRRGILLPNREHVLLLQLNELNVPNTITHFLHERTNWGPEFRDAEEYSRAVRGSVGDTQDCDCGVFININML